MTILKQFRSSVSFPLTFVVTFIGVLDTHLLIPVIALYASTLGASVGTVGWIVGLYSVAHVPANIIFGRVIDRVGYKAPLVVGLVGDAISMFLYTLCRLPLHLAIVRLLHGVGGGLTGPATMKLASERTAQAERGRTMGFYGMAIGMATLVGYGASSVVVSRLGYEPLFYVGSAALLLGVLLSLAVAPSGEGGARAKLSPRTDAMRLASLFRRKGLTISYCSAFAHYFSFGGVVTLLPLYVRQLGEGVFYVGMLLAAFSVVFVLLQFFSGAISDRIGRQIPITAGLSFGVVSVSVLPMLGALPLLFVAMAVYGAGFAMLFPSISALVVDHTMPEERGLATGIFHSLLTGGVAAGAPTMGWVAHLTGIRWGLALSSGAAGLALLIVLVVSMKELRPKAWVLPGGSGVI